METVLVASPPLLEANARPGLAIQIANHKGLMPRLAKRAGIEKRVTAHTLRHTAATWLRQATGDARLVAAYLGHADEGFTFLAAAPFAASFAAGEPRTFEGWRVSFVDGAGGQSVIPRMWARMAPVADGAIVVSLDETRAAMRLMAEKSRVIAEGAGALPLAAALTGNAGPGPIVAIVSGGNLDLKKFCELIDV